MKAYNGFLLMNRQEFRNWLLPQNVNRRVTMIHNHHTYIPDYSNFNQDNHFNLVVAMKNFHMNIKRWADIGQQITTFPDGQIIVGTRSLEVGPACIRYQNDSAICIEHVGNFNKGGDRMTKAHKETIVFVNALLHLKFHLEVNDINNVYHHWFDLSTGERKNGGGVSKTCPGTNFFGGNKPADAKRKFLPLVRKELKKQPEFESVFGYPPEEPIGYAIVRRANVLNVRSGPGTSHKKIGTLTRGNLVDVYERVPRWVRISPEQKWVSAYYVKTVRKGVVIDDDPKGLSVRTGPSVRYRKVDALMEHTPVTIFETSDNGWHRISYLDLWVSGRYVEEV